MPMVAAGLQHEATTKGEEGLSTALGSGQHEAYLTQPTALADPSTITDGNAILGHIFGTKDVSRQVADNAAQKTGIDPALLRKMLPIVAAIVMATLARRAKAAGTGQSSGDGGRNIPTPSPTPAPAPRTGGLGSILGSLLDKDRDGSVIDDIGGMIGGSLNRR
jgi:hypothetical protein